MGDRQLAMWASVIGKFAMLVRGEVAGSSIGNRSAIDFLS
jgi:hypothetical protein